MLLPSINSLREILQAVRKKYNIPEVLPENVQLAKTLFQERTLEEWQAIGDEIEAKLRENFPIPDFGIMKIYDAFKESASKSPELEQLINTKIEFGDPKIAMLINGLMGNSVSGFRGLDIVYKVGAIALLDNMITGRPIEIPIEWANMVVPMTLPFDNHKIVTAIATEASEPDELISRFRKRITETFGEGPKDFKRTVKQSANELTSINEVLKDTIEVNIPVQNIKETITRNQDVEQNVARAAGDLHQINIELAKEVAGRAVIESELADAKASLVEVRKDLLKSQTKEEETRQITLHDTLTSLPNRMLFEQRLEHGLIQAKRHGWGLAVLFVDIDKFKSINDSYGHDLGDKVLVMVANRLKSSVRDEDTVSRWGGDEFVCVLLDVKQEADVSRIAERMANRIAAACEFNGIVLSIRASIGIAIYPIDGETADVLFKNADRAMFKAKGTEKGVVPFRQESVTQAVGSD